MKKEKLLAQIRTLLRRESKEFIFEPVSHPLNPYPVLSQGIMEAIAPAYEEALAKENQEKAPRELSE